MRGRGSKVQQRKRDLTLGALEKAPLRPRAPCPLGEARGIYAACGMLPCALGQRRQPARGALALAMGGVGGLEEAVSGNFFALAI